MITYALYTLKAIALSLWGSKIDPFKIFVTENDCLIK